VALLLHDFLATPGQASRGRLPGAGHPPQARDGHAGEIRRATRAPLWDSSGGNTPADTACCWGSGRSPDGGGAYHGQAPEYSQIWPGVWRLAKGWISSF
jgi:hypothetical protein